LSTVAPESVHLYRADSGSVEGVGISSSTDEIVHFTRSSGNLVGAGTGISLQASQYAVAGGPDGAAVWMWRADGWYRARPTGGTWTLDVGPIEDPNPSGKHHAAGATSDGALYIAYAVDTGSFFDDTEAPFLRRLAPDASTFDARVQAANSADDYLTSLVLHNRGRGLIVDYCGSDVDPWGLSSTGYKCFAGARTADGASLLYVPTPKPTVKHAFTRTRIAVASCDDDDMLRISTDPENDSGEAILWPCPEVVGLEIDANAEYVPVVNIDGQLYSMQRRGTTTPDVGSDGGAL